MSSRRRLAIGGLVVAVLAVLSIIPFLALVTMSFSRVGLLGGVSLALLAGFVADHPVQLADHPRVRVGAHHRPQAVVGGLHGGHPVTHRLVHGVLEGAHHQFARRDSPRGRSRMRARGVWSGGDDGIKRWTFEPRAPQLKVDFSGHIQLRPSR